MMQMYNIILYKCIIIMHNEIMPALFSSNATYTKLTIFILFHYYLYYYYLILFLPFYIFTYIIYFPCRRKTRRFSSQESTFDCKNVFTCSRTENILLEKKWELIQTENCYVKQIKFFRIKHF